MDPRYLRCVMCLPLPPGTLTAMNPQSSCPAAHRRGVNDSASREPGLRPPWMRAARVAAVSTIIAPAALLVAACGGSPSSASSAGSPGAGGQATSGVAVAYSRCMRSHGIPDFPDPGSNGQISKQAIIQLGVSGSRLQTAQRACQALWPYQAPTQAQQRQELADDLKFAQCMRSHGVPEFPDPTSSGAQVEFVISISRIGMSKPQLLAKAHECQHVLPTGTALPEATMAP